MNTIPLLIVDDHNDVLDFTLRKIGSKKLKFENNLIIHFDSHPDLLIEEGLTMSDVFSKETLTQKVNIETWILPLTVPKHVTTIVWVKPEWSNQIDSGVYDFFIGESLDGEIKVSESMFYFISGLVYAPLKELKNTSKVSLHVFSYSKNEETNLKSIKLLNDLVHKHEGNYILDVDLDFFSTANPFLKMYEKVNFYERLKQFYKFDEKEVQNDPEQAQRIRCDQIKTLEKIFTILQSNTEIESKRKENSQSNRESETRNKSVKTENDSKDIVILTEDCKTTTSIDSDKTHFNSDRKNETHSVLQPTKNCEHLKSKNSNNLTKDLKEILAHIPDSEQLSKLIDDLKLKYGSIIDWEMIHNAGTTIDNENRKLPHHVSTITEIDEYVNYFEVLVSKLKPPKVVTIARSVSDEYCPEDQVDGIEEKVTNVICRYFKCEIDRTYLKK